MKKLFLYVTAILLIASCATKKEITQTVEEVTNIEANPMKPIDNMPPLIDREIIFGNPEISGAQLSPDGKWMSFMKPFDDVRNIWLKQIDEAFEDAKPITADTERPIPGYFWSRDSKYILYVQDKGGDENYHVYSLDPTASPAEGSQVPEARNITNADGIRAIIYSVPRSTPDWMYVGINDRDKAWHDLYKVQISTGERELIKKNEDQITNWIFDLDDKLRMASKTDADGGTVILAIDGDKFKEIYSCSVLETCGVYTFEKGNEKAYFISNKGDVDLTQLLKIDPITGETEFMESDPKGKVDFGGIVTSDITHEIIATSYTGDKTKLYFKNKEWEAEYNWLKEQLPGAEISMGSSTDDERNFLIYANSDTDPGATYLYNRDTKTLDFQYRPRPKLPVKDLAKMQVISYPSSDGLEIPAYLTLPKGIDAKNLPLIIFPHGGPWARDYWGYNPYAQFLANRGYAVLNVNFRGSTGYGKDFLNAGNNEWGELMQDDLTYGGKHLINEGIADPERIGIMGGSYGGYATLAGMTFTPDFYGAGVSIVGPSNMITLLESIPPYWESIRKMFHERMGNPNTEEGKAQLMRQSPLFHADKITTPLMVVQGANDPRVKKAESDQIVIAMRELGLPVEYICAPDEGHGFSRPENNMAFLAACEKFLAKHLGGRYQKDMPDHIAKRLEEITVDINSVTMPEAIDVSKLESDLPLPTSDLKPGDTAYKMVINMGGQEIPMDVNQTISEKDGHWEVVQRISTPMGNMEDVSVVKKNSLEPISRSVDQGPMKIKLTHAAESISGTVNMNGNETPLDVTLDKPVFADGGALYETLARLPLAEGYKAVYRTFDVQKQIVKAFEINVIARESIDVSGGTFDTFKAEIKALDDNPGDTMLWLSAEEDYKGLIKSTGTSPEMGGAKITIELSQK